MVTNTNTVGTYLTNYVVPQHPNHQTATKRTVATDLNLQHNPRLSTHVGEMSESQRDANGEHTRTVVYSSTTSQVDGQALNYATDNNSYVVRATNKDTRAETPYEGKQVSTNPNQNQESSALKSKSRNDAFLEG